ncbi:MULTISPECIES: hypothetical protein [Rhodomicrobium]|uniref:hypothetical protein n=1 Tax=Rhodomicrobium TaxID=1068 RepID=UPI0014835334|nr:MULTISPECIES: hypothetical protein [Rhodomicrobium]
MIRSILAAAIVAIFAAPSAQAASNDCISKYKDFWDKQNEYANAKPSIEDVIATNRQGIRAFDACQSGDEVKFDDFWDKIKQYSNSKEDQEKFWTELQKVGAAKK